MTVKTPVIVWLRRDLRLSDHPAFLAAAERGPVIPVYIHAPEEEGDRAPGAASCWWLHHSLAALSGRLADMGSRLIVRRGPVLATLQGLAQECGADSIYWNRLYDPPLVERDRRVKEALREAGFETRSFAAALLFEPWTVETGSGTPYKVFTPYWRRCRPRLATLSPMPAPEQLRAPERWPQSEEPGALALLPDIRWDAGFSADFSPGEAGATRQLYDFCDDALGGYTQGRDLPAEDGISRLSPHLHFGEITPRSALAIVNTRGAAAEEAGREAWIRQLGWRDFAHHVLWYNPRTPDEPLRPEYRDFPWRPDYGALLLAWQQGRTGIPLVDAGMHELWTTGWMHNRVRMIVASLLVKNLRIPWQEGERWFWDTLLDADLANNTMGWQWAAGCGADAAPYFRVFNPVRQGERFDPAGAYVRRWIPALAKVPDRKVHQPWQMSEEEQQAAGCVIGRDYPAPVVDLKESREAALAAYHSLKDGSA